MWLDQLPLFSDVDISHMLDDVHFRPRPTTSTSSASCTRCRRSRPPTSRCWRSAARATACTRRRSRSRIADTAKHGELLLAPRRALPVRRGPGALLGRRRGLAQQNPLSTSLNSLASSTSESGSTTASSGVPGAQPGPGRNTSTAAPARARPTRALPTQLAVAHEADVERARRLAPAVEDDRHVAGRVGLARRARRGRAASPADGRRRTPRARCGSASRARRASGSRRPRGSSPAPAALQRSCRTCTASRPAP